MIRRSEDAAHVNALANHPAIHPWVSAGIDELDLTPVVEDQRNRVFETEGGAFVLHRLYPGVFEAHSLFLPEVRGELAISFAKECMAHLFAKEGCEAILARCPKGNLAVLAFTRALKFEFIGVDKDAWPTVNGLVDQRWYRMTRDHWRNL